ncbi:MAG: magnesium transporter, partial [Myxococcota bacterium]
MQPRKSRLLHDTLRRYVRHAAWSNLDRLIAKTRTEELAAVMGSMTERDQMTIFERLPTATDKADLIVSMQAPFGKLALEPLDAEQAAKILREMASDDMVDILADLEPEQASKILEILGHSEEVEDLMQYRDDTAGGIMLPEFVALPAETTAEEALIALRAQTDVEMVYYIYVVSEAGQLVGVLSLRKLVVAPPHKRVREFMETDLITVTTDTDQEDVARLVTDYGFLAIPVVDDANKLLGVVTVDDVIEVLKEEANEDFMKMAGAGSGMAYGDSVLKHVWIRFPWLLASCAGGLVAAMVLEAYEDTLKAETFLALFVPVILGMSGNVGTQSATVVVRGIAMGLISKSERTWVVVRKEMGISLCLGGLYGVLIGGLASLIADQPIHGLSIGLSIAVGMFVAATIGSVIPI